MPAILSIILSEGKYREKAVEYYHELLKVFEVGIEKDFPDKSPFFKGDSLGFLDIVVGTVACNYQAFHEVVTVIFEPAKHPSFFSWVTALKEHPLVKEILPPRDKLVAGMKEKYFQFPITTNLMFLESGVKRIKFIDACRIRIWCTLCLHLK